MSENFWKERYEQLKDQMSSDKYSVVECEREKCSTIRLYSKEKHKFMREIHHESHCESRNKGYKCMNCSRYLDDCCIESFVY